MKIFLALCLALSVSAVGARAACVEIQCPADIKTPCTGPNGAVVNFTPTASTTCDAPIEVQCEPPSGSVFPIGTNTVLCVVRDTRGNIARCDFQVIVTTEPPVIKCPEDITIECHSPLGSVVAYPLPTATASCGATVAVACNPPSGSVFPIGTNFVQCVATDSFGRTARCAFSVTVTNGPATIICPPPMTLNTSTGCFAVLPVIPVTVLERCTPTNKLVFWQSPSAGTVLFPGNHVVTVYVSEGNHIDASCTVPVQVVDKTPPVIQCPPNIWKYCAPTGATATFDVTATDACKLPVTVTCEPPSGSFFPTGTTQVKCKATDVEGNSSECGFSVIVTPASQFMSFVGGKKDGYVQPVDPPHHSACLLAATAGLSLGSQFDISFAGRWLGHSFENLPGGIQWAKMRFRMKPKSNASSNDVVRIGLKDCAAGPGNPWLWSAPIASLPEAGGQWTVNGDTYFTLDLSALPGAPAALLPLLDVETTHRLDLIVGDDTIVDWVSLDLGVCGVSGAAGGVPYVVKKGAAARGAGSGLRLYSEDRLPFDVDLHIGKADGIEIGFGDDWPGATNLPPSECAGTIGKQELTEIEWKPNGGDTLCFVKFLPDIVSEFTDVFLWQPTNIMGGRAVEVWSKGQLVTRYYVTNEMSGVVLRDDACLFTMGFGQGEFFISLMEPSDVWFVSGKHISGDPGEPVQGDFIRMFFNIPFTAGGGRPTVEFDPDIVINIKGRELKSAGLKVRKLGSYFENFGEGLMSVGDNITVAPKPSESEWTVSTCHTPAVKAGDENDTEWVTLTMDDLFVGKAIKPGVAFELVATAEYGLTPPVEGTIGRVHGEIVSVDPLITRFRVDCGANFEETDLALFQLNNITVVPSHKELDIIGAPKSLTMFIHDNYANFILQFDDPSGVEVNADGQTVKEVETAWFTARNPLPGIHRKPYRFCVTPYQAWEQKPINFSSPVPPPPPAPPLAPCVTLQCPTNIIRWSRGGEGVAVRFEVEARSTCGSNITVRCEPSSGSEFKPGVTWVHCYAVDELGNSARGRFPVVVYDQEPKLSVERREDGVVRVWCPAEFLDWSLEGAQKLNSPHWERMGRWTNTDGSVVYRDFSVGDPSKFYRLQAP